jgi:hypothetical protein
MGINYQRRNTAIFGDKHLYRFRVKGHLYVSKVIQNTMSRDKFELLRKFLHFSNNEEQNANQDRLAKLTPFLGLIAVC